MKHCVFIFVALLSASAGLMAQPVEFYQSTVLIQGKWGNAPGEYGHSLIGSDQHYADTFALDRNEHVYVLDELNNRVQHYDDKGKLLAVIPLVSYAPTTREQRKTTSREQSVGIDRFEFVGETLLADQQFYLEGPRGKPLNRIMKLVGNQFILVDSSTESARLLNEMSYRAHQHKIHALLSKDSKFLEKGARTNKGIGSLFATYDGLPIGDVFVDQNSNRWIISAVRNTPSRKYSPSGKLLFEFSTGNSAPHISSHGNIYVLGLLSASAQDADDAFVAQGIKITRYSLK